MGDYIDKGLEIRKHAILELLKKLIEERNFLPLAHTRTGYHFGDAVMEYEYLLNDDELDDFKTWLHTQLNP